MNVQFGSSSQRQMQMRLLLQGCPDLASKCHQIASFKVLISCGARKQDRVGDERQGNKQDNEIFEHFEYVTKQIK